MAATVKEVVETIRFHFPLSEKELPQTILLKYINNANKFVVTQLNALPKYETDQALTSGALSLTDTYSDFYRLRYPVYSGKKLVKMVYDNIRQIPTVYDDELRYYYIRENDGDVSINVVNGDDENIDVYYYAYPATQTITGSIGVDDEHTDVVVDKVCMNLAKSKAPNLFKQYAASYRQNFLDAKKHYIKKNDSNRGYVVPMHY